MQGTADQEASQRPKSEVDETAFGVIYGTITVLSVLIALHQPIDNPLRTAFILFGAVFAVALAKAYAEVCRQMLAKARSASVADMVGAWRHARTIMLAANPPAACMVLAALGLLSVETAFLGAQITAIGGLVFFGGHIGWRIKRTIPSVLAGAGVTALIGLLISSLKYLAH